MSSPRKRGYDADYLPEHQGAAFEAQLKDLLEREAPAYGFGGEYLLSELWSKYRDPQGEVTDEQRRDAAIDKWLLVEERNRSTNCRLLIEDDDYDFGWVRLGDFYAKARSVIREILGDTVPYPQIFEGGYYTNGASTRVKRSSTASIEKLTGVAHVSTSAVKHWLQAASNTRLADQCLQLYENSVLFTVPKATDIDRVACKEPEVNMFLQRCVGIHMRKKLLRVGIDLRDQTRNQNLAGTAFSEGLATVDLSSASDTVTSMLVYRLLPFDWWSLLDDLRVKTTEVRGEIHELEMFSSMGNGFTFELETLIFYALARTIGYFSGLSGTISVYGDDIIVPCSYAPRLARIFSFFGFKVNPKKSHWRGAFRESCGKHFYRNRDATPFYVRGPVRRKSDVIRLLNQLLIWDGSDFSFFVNEEFLRFHMKWAKVIPTQLWGGQDPMDPSALVTGHPPRDRLVPKTKGKRTDEGARLTTWFLVKARSPLAVEVAPSEVRYTRTSPQPGWTVRTAWDPWLLSTLPGYQYVLSL